MRFLAKSSGPAIFVALLLLPSLATARPPIRKAFFNVYPSAVGTRLDDLTSNPGHCGVCHLDFNGGGPRNPYGLAVQVAIASGNYATTEDAIASLDLEDSDADGYSNHVEITDVLNFTNTPTFPGLTATNVSAVLNVDVGEIQGYLTPMGSNDTTPPTVTVFSPSGGESFPAQSTQLVTWTADDASGISHVDIYMSDDGGTSFKQVARQEADDGTYDWFVPNLPGTQTVIRVAARDNAGNYGSGDSNGTFTIEAQPGLVPTTLRDIEMPGTQPLGAGTFENVDQTCVTCHGNYNQDVEPWYHWRGSMMAQAARDPLFYACMAVSEQDAPSVGDLCIRCHSPGGWLEGRSTDTSGEMLTAKDRLGVQCDFCHRVVDPIYQPGVSPAIDQDILAALDQVPPTYANGNFVADPDPIRRGPYADAVASHQFLESPVHRKGDMCGTCHDVSNPVFVRGAGLDEYVPDVLDQEHPDGDLRNMFPIERTYSEWSVSEYATTGVYAPQFAGNKADGIVSTCQDCHMHDVSGKGCSEPGAPVRADLALHDLTGGNYFINDVLPDLYPTEVDVGQLQASKQRAIGMLQKAASMSLSGEVVDYQPVVTVTITNETAHKLPSGYPEGRRIWINLRALDGDSNLIYESGAYDAATGVLTHDADLKVYEIHPGISTRLAPAVGLPAGPSFHFVLNDSVYFDNRIPPRGFTNAAFEAVQSPPVDYAYPDGQYWDDSVYVLPAQARYVEVNLYYQSTSKEFVEYLKDENVSNDAGQVMYDEWVAHGRCAPVAMLTDFITLDVTGSDVPDRFVTDLAQNSPNPFNASTRLDYTLSRDDRALIEIYDVQGRFVRTLVDGIETAGPHTAVWDGTDERGRTVASGVYVARFATVNYTKTVRMVLVK